MAFGNVLGQSNIALPYINGNYDAGNHNIKNVADPIDETDAVNLRSINNQINIGSLFKKNLIHTSVFTSASTNSDSWAPPELTFDNIPLGYYFDITANDLEAYKISLSFSSQVEQSDLLSIATLESNKDTNNWLKNFNFSFICFVSDINLADSNLGYRATVEVLSAESFYTALNYSNDERYKGDWSINVGVDGVPISGSLTVSMYWF